MARQLPAVSLFFTGGFMESLRVYRIDDKYIKYLRTHDFRVQYNKAQRRPYVGIVLKVGSFRYFVPMESPKPNHTNMKSAKHLFKLDGGRYGLLGFNNMIPVHESALINYDVDNEKDTAYRELLRNQIRICNRNKADIYDRAQHTYFSVTNRSNPFIVKISCNFKVLEKACGNYHA